MGYFDKGLFEFLTELKTHNDRAWFTKNKARFEQEIKEPFLDFISDAGPQLRKISKSIVADPRPVGGSLFRIYRDVRFSKDKSPYKSHIGMNFWHAQCTETIHAPGFYLHIDPAGCFLAGGVWHPDPRSLARIRDAIAWKQEDWRSAKRGLALGGDTLTRPPRGYSGDHPLIEDLKRKDLIASVELTQAQVCSGRFMENILRSGRKMVPFLRFLSEAVKLRF